MILTAASVLQGDPPFTTVFNILLDKVVRDSDTTRN